MIKGQSFYISDDEYTHLIPFMYFEIDEALAISKMHIRDSKFVFPICVTCNIGNTNYNGYIVHDNTIAEIHRMSKRFISFQYSQIEEYGSYYSILMYGEKHKILKLKLTI